MTDTGGYIKLSRKYFNNAYWKQERTFSLAEAWLDLIQMARFDADPATKVLPSGREITIQRGELHAGLRYLSNRWSWSVEKTKRYIDKHIEKNEIERRTEHSESILKLSNYDIYNPLPNTAPNNGQDIGCNTHTNADQTPARTNNKKEKEGRKEEIFTPPTFEEVETYCRERENGISPKSFIDFYESKGWMIGKNKMKNWKAAVRTWEGNTRPPEPAPEDPRKCKWKASSGVYTGTIRQYEVMVNQEKPYPVEFLGYID